MQKWGLVLLAAAAGLLAVVPATARMLDHATIPDAAGDGDPDITQVVVGSNASGGLTFVTQIGNRTQLADNEFVFVMIDSDANQATGQPPNGVDYALALTKEGAAVLRWTGTTFEVTDAQTVYGYTYKGFRIGVNKSDIGVTTNELNFWVETASGDRFDEAPNGEFAVYPLSSNPLRLTIRSVNAPKTVKVGRRFTVALTAHRSDLDEITSAGDVVCTAKVGARSVRLARAFPAEAAQCIGAAPRNAKNKTLKVTISLALDGARVSRTVSIKVR